MVSTVLTVTERLAPAEVWPSESVTVTVKFAVPAMGLEPPRTPLWDTLRPTPARLVEPAVTVQVE